MSDEKAHNGKGNGRWGSILIGVVAAAIGSTGTVAIYLNTDIGQSVARPDPFLGAQGRVLESRIAALEQINRSHISNHPDAVNQFDRRISQLEARVELILANQSRILDRLER